MRLELAGNTALGDPMLSVSFQALHLQELTHSYIFTHIIQNTRKSLTRQQMNEQIQIYIL